MTENVSEIVDLFRVAIEDQWPREVSVSFKDAMTEMFDEVGLTERNPVETLKVMIDDLGTISIGSDSINEDTNWITVAKAAKVAGVSADTIRDRANANEVRSMKINGTLHIAESDAEQVETKIYVARKKNSKKNFAPAPQIEQDRRYEFIRKTLSGVDKMRIRDLRQALIDACDFSCNKNASETARWTINRLVETGEIDWINLSGNKTPGVDDYVCLNRQTRLPENGGWLSTFHRR